MTGQWVDSQLYGKRTYLWEEEGPPGSRVLVRGRRYPGVVRKSAVPPDDFLDGSDELKFWCEMVENLGPELAEEVVRANLGEER